MFYLYYAPNFTVCTVKQLVSCSFFNITVINTLMPIVCCCQLFPLILVNQYRCTLGDYAFKERKHSMASDANCHIQPLTIFTERHVSVYLSFKASFFYF